MLFEKNIYQEDFPFRIRILQVTEYPIHYHQDIDFIFVLKGEVHLKNMCHHYLLKEGDLFTNSGHEIHGLTSTGKDNIIAMVQISNRYFTQYFPTLDKACFMTYVNNDKYFKQDELKKMFLNILLDYSMKSLNYKSSCIDKMIGIINHLNQYYNLFAFEDMTVVNFRSNNPVIVERISRITNYIYANHARKLTLEDIAKLEHLSTYYLSHLIRDNIGISFQEFLCFARVEMSELILLETDLKISEVAKEVGFSTTSYYNKYFTKWYGHSPQEHRNYYTPLILSDTRSPQVKILSDSQAVSYIRQRLSVVCDQDNSSSIMHRLNLSVSVNPEGHTIKNLYHKVDVVITLEDYNVMGERLFNLLYELNASKVVIASHVGDNETTTALITNRLNFMGYEVTNKCDNGDCFYSSAGYDSIASAIDVFLNYFISKEENLCCRLRDQGDMSKMLKGNSSCLTSAMIPKPSYYAFKLLSNLRGDLIHMGKYYYVVKDNSSETDSYILIVMNYNDEIKELCKRDLSVYEAKEIINSFRDELLVDFDIPLCPGKYVIATYELENSNSIFTHMSNLEFPEKSPISESWIRMLNTEPQAQLRLETVKDALNINEIVKGAGISITSIKRLIV